MSRQSDGVLIELVEALEAVREPRDACAAAAEAVRDATGAEGVWIELAWEARPLEVVTATGVRSDLQGDTPAWPGALASPLQAAVQVVRAGAEPAGAADPGDGAPGAAGELIVAPLRVRGEARGALVLQREPGSGAFGEGDVVAARLAAGALSLALGRLAAELAGRRAAERMGRLVRAVSHDLKNPLGAVAGYTQLLETGIRGELADEQREWTTRINRSVDGMLALLSDLLDLARIESGALDLDEQPVPLAGLLRESVRTARDSGAGADIETDIPERLPTVVADPGRVLQIVGGLLTLLQRSATDGGTIRVEAREDVVEEGAACAVRLSAHAPSLAAVAGEEVPFQGIFHVDAAPDRGTGTGLELALARRLARLLGGDLELSRAGDTAVLTLRLAGADSY